MPIEDQQARLQAIDPNKSFIVQAPAGSGKTGLLTQRFLKLLAIVKQPEEIVAITFTRKAASEMHERIFYALKHANELLNSSEAYEQETGKLANLVLNNNKIQQWNILQQSHRLKVQTIDSLCADISRQMPLLSKFGAVPSISQHPQYLYLEAAKEALSELETDSIFSESISALLSHLDNRLDKLQELLANMLSKREQWLRHVASDEISRSTIEDTLIDVVRESIDDVVRLFPSETIMGLKDNLCDLLTFASNNSYSSSSSQESLMSCREINKSSLFCDPYSLNNADTLTLLQQWQAISNWLMTGKSKSFPNSLNSTQREWRKTVTTNHGFPTATSVKSKEDKQVFKEKKEQMLQLLSSLKESGNNTSHAWQSSLGLLDLIPSNFLSDDDWSIVHHLFRLLKRSVAYLTVVFSQQGEVDYAEIALSAKRALGTEEQPTDLGLRLEHKIKHLLVDEFQDTSQHQFDLFKQLTIGWQANDGHSLFIVGDPMQSIYRFREAEVGLFLKAWEQGIGDVELTPLKLSVNFRSQAGIIEWVNNSFIKAFPLQDEINRGAVKYSPSIAFRDKLTQQAVHYYPFLSRQDDEEATKIIDIIKQAKENDPKASIAILVRNRTHLISLIKQLKSAQNNSQNLDRNNFFAFQAVEIERLTQVPMIVDLVMLTRCILNLDDRVAWLSLIRSPFIGLDLSTILTISQDKTILSGISNQILKNNLSSEQTKKLQFVNDILQATINNKDKNSLRESVETCWLTLGGATIIQKPSDKEDVLAYFDLLSSLDSTQTDIDIVELDYQINQLFSQPDNQSTTSDQIQLMTIHKSKGLEFDTVIIPGLGRTPMVDSAQLLYWLEKLNKHGESTLLFSSIKNALGIENKISTYIKLFEQEKGLVENTRLLYVAATRAKKYLHLLWHNEYDDKKDELKKPDKRSLLASLWSVVKSIDGYYQLQNTEEVEQNESSKLNQKRNILSEHWSCPIAKDINYQTVKLINSEDESSLDSDVELLFDWASDSARIIGLVVHRILQYIGENNLNLSELTQSELEIKVSLLLEQYNLVEDEFKLALKQALKALNNCLNDDKGQWILSTNHIDSANEKALTGVINNNIKHIVIDRTFIDDNDVRWIIDYKTGAHQGGGLAEFLQHEKERYQYQLDSYAAIYANLEKRKTRKALYFPMIPAWLEC